MQTPKENPKVGDGYTQHKVELNSSPLMDESRLVSYRSSLLEAEIRSGHIDRALVLIAQIEGDLNTLRAKLKPSPDNSAKIDSVLAHLEDGE